MALLILLGLLSCLRATKYERVLDGFTATETVVDDWYSVYLLDIKAGYNHITVIKGTLKGEEVVRVVNENSILFNFEDVDKPVASDIYGEALLTADGKNRLLGFTYRMSILSHEVVMDGVRSGDNILIDLSSGGGEQHIKFPADENIYPSVALSYIAMEELAKDSELTPGRTFSFRVFVESLKAVKDMEVKIVGTEEMTVFGEKLKVFEVETKIEGYVLTSWVGVDGRVVKEVTMERFEAVLEEKESAENLEGAGITYDDILEIALVPSSERLLNPEGLALLKVKIEDFTRSSAALTGDFQSIEGPDEDGGYIFTMKRGEVDKSVPVEYGSFPEGVREYLLPSVDIESDHRLVIEKAKEITKGVNPIADAEKILEWVNENVDKRMVDATSALDALKTMEGECESHAYLLAALSRARGIPTKVISGIVYSEEMDGFFFHAWNEVYLGKWIPVDATFGQFPADVTHIKFSEGGRSALLDIVPLIGTIKVEVLKTERD